MSMIEDSRNLGPSASLLMKMFSLEFLVSAIMAIFALGAVYTSLNSNIADAQETSEKNKEKLVLVSDDLAKIKTNIAVIQANQNAMSHELQEAADNSKETQRDVKEILRILGGNGHTRFNERAL